MIETIASIVEPLTGVPRISPNDTLSRVFTVATGTHALVLVGNGEKPETIVWPHLLMTGGRLLPTQPVRSVAVTAPHLTSDTSVQDALNSMVELRVYELPVFSDRQINGIVRAITLLKSLRHDPLLDQVLENLRPVAPVIVPDTETVASVASNMQKNRISRVLVRSGQGQYRIVSRRDIFTAASEGVFREKSMRAGTRTGTRVYDPSEDSSRTDPVKRFGTSDVTMVAEDHHPKALLDTLINQEGKSIVLTDRAGSPIGVVSTRTFLRAFISSLSNITVPIILTDRTHTLSTFRLWAVSDLLERLYRKAHSRGHKLDRVECVIGSDRETASPLYQATLSLHADGKSTVRSRDNHHDIVKLLHSVINKAERQLLDSH